MKEDRKNISAFYRKMKGIEAVNVLVHDENYENDSNECDDCESEIEDETEEVPIKKRKVCDKNKKKQDRIQCFIDSRGMVGN